MYEIKKYILNKNSYTKKKEKGTFLSLSFILCDGVKSLYKVNEQVDVYVQRKHLGRGKISDVCQTKRCIERYFNEKHPFFILYMKTIEKNEKVFIVDFEYDLGQGGYVKEQVQKIEKRR